MESVKNSKGELLYHVQSLTDWHEPVDMFVFSDHEPTELDMRRLVIRELSLDEQDEACAVDEFTECSRAYHVYTQQL
jgi:hypothetical protein